MISIFNGTERRLGANATQSVYAKLDVAFRDHICEFTRSGDSDLGVFIAISLHADENGRAYPSIHTLMRETGYERATISRALARLVKLRINGQRILLRYQRTAKNGTFTSNQYIILPSPGEVTEFETQPGIAFPSSTGEETDISSAQPVITPQPCIGQPYTVEPDTVSTRVGLTDTQTRNSVLNKNQFSKKNHAKGIVGGAERRGRKKEADNPSAQKEGDVYLRFFDAMKYFGVREPKRTLVAQRLADYTATSGRGFSDVLRGVWRVYCQAEGLEASGKISNGIGFAISQWERCNGEILATNREAMAQIGLFETDVTQTLATWARERNKHQDGVDGTRNKYQSSKVIQ